MQIAGKGGACKGYLKAAALLAERERGGRVQNASSLTCQNNPRPRLATRDRKLRRKVGVLLHGRHAVCHEGCRPQQAAKRRLLEVDALEERHVDGTLRVRLFMVCLWPHVNEDLQRTCCSGMV